MNIHKPKPIELGSLFRSWKGPLETAANERRDETFVKIEQLAKEHADEIRLVLVSSDEWIQETAVHQMYSEKGTPGNHDLIFERSKNSVVSVANRALAIGRKNIYSLSNCNSIAFDLADLESARYFDNNVYTTLIFDTSHEYVKIEIIEPTYKGLSIAEICDLATGVVTTRNERLRTTAPFFDDKARNSIMQDLWASARDKIISKKDAKAP